MGEIMSRIKKISNQQRRNAETWAKLRDWGAAKTPLQIKIGSRVLTLQPLEGGPADDVMTLRTRQGFVSIIGPRPRAKKESRKVKVTFPKDFSQETLMGKKPQP
jgi:hypothetical protein